MREQDIAAAVRTWLIGLERDVFAEVDGVPGRGRARADLVGVYGDAAHSDLWVVECKLALSFDALGQAYDWKDYAHAVFVATATVPTGRGYLAAHDALAAANIGWLRVDEGEDPAAPPEVHYERVPTPRVGTEAPRRTGLLYGALRPAHRAAVPGVAGGARPWTDDDEHHARLAVVVKGEPGIPLERALSTAGWEVGPKELRVVAKLLRNGVVPCVEARGRGRKLTLFPCAEVA